MFPASTSAGKDVMLRLVAGPGKDAHELSAMQTLRKLQQKEKHRCWSRILDFYEMGPWTFMASEFDQARISSILDFQTLGDCVGFIRQVTYVSVFLTVCLVH